MTRIGTTRFGCDCTVHVEPDINGITPWLEHCARHGAAPDLLGALKAMVALCICRGTGVYRVKEGGRGNRTRFIESDCARCESARAAITKAEGKR